MTAKLTTYKGIEEAIGVAFEGDEKIFELYDPFHPVTNIEEIKTDIVGKLKSFDHEPILKAVYEKNTLIGYYAYYGKNLISFSLNLQYRTRKYLKEFFTLIRQDLKGTFFTLLWTKNIRAIKYLIKQGLNVIDQNQFITVLKYN